MSSNRNQDGALLAALLSARGRPVARHDLARAAEIPPDELDRRLAPYLEAGYPVEFHPPGEISLKEPPDIWCAEEILGRCPSWDPLLLVETASTNDVAREQGRRGARACFVVAASHQTKGRGRLGRHWESPPNRGLYVSILLRPDLPLTEAGRLTILSSVAVRDAVEAVSGLRLRIKWPNDLFAGDRKLAGLLIETEQSGTRLAFAVIGIGLNLRHEADDFSPGVRDLATSLYLATGQLHRRADVLVALLHAFERRLSQPFAEVREAWAASSLTLGQRLILTTAQGEKQGQAVGLDESGALLLQDDSGKVEVVTAGDMRAV